MEGGSLDHKKVGGWATFPFIIGTLGSLTIAAGGWASNLIVFLITQMNVKNIKATQINNVVLGCFSLFPIVGAILSDSFFGPFSVIAFFSSISLLGVILLTFIMSFNSLRPSPCTNLLLPTSCEDPSTFQFAILYAALTLASLGLGGTRFTLATIGADQFKTPGQHASFFNWFFITIYIANAISFTAIIYIEDNVSWRLGFGICIICNVVGLVVFVLGKRFYRHVKPKGSPFTSIARVVVASFRKRKMCASNSRTDQHNYYSESFGTTKIHNVPTKSFRFLNYAAMKLPEEQNASTLDGPYSKSWKLCTVEEVEDLKTLIKIVPLWSTGIFVSTPIGMLTNLVILQALTMDRHIGPHFKIPAGTFLVFNLLATAISIAFVDHLVLPAWKRVTRRQLTLLQRVGIGHVVNIVGIVSAALVEMRRLYVVRTDHLGHEAHDHDVVVPMPALWLVVPLFLVGLGEGFHVPGQVSLYYQEFPTSLKSLSTAMISALIGIGYYLSSAITDLVTQTTTWLPDNINKGRVDKVYWLLAVVGLVNFVYYLVCAITFKPKIVHNESVELSDSTM